MKSVGSTRRKVTRIEHRKSMSSSQSWIQIFKEFLWRIWSTTLNSWAQKSEVSSACLLSTNDHHVFQDIFLQGCSWSGQICWGQQRAFKIIIITQQLSPEAKVWLYGKTPLEKLLIPKGQKSVSKSFILSPQYTCS